MDFRLGAITKRAALKGSEKQQVKREIKSAKKEQMKECKKLKGRAKRQCKRNIRRNVRKSRNNLFREGKSGFSKALSSIAAPVLSLGANALTGGIAGSISPKKAGFGLSPKGLKTTMADNGMSFKDILKGQAKTFSDALFGDSTTPVNETGNGKKRGAKFGDYMTKAQTYLKKPVVYIPALVVAVFIVGYKLIKRNRI